uniref:Uncharacterized protein n=1 Tax=Chenopodium quinoa TaxID=63459 RepID=A0A803KR30_CHEQI
MLFYFDRVEFIGGKVDRKVPVISCWNSSTIGQRITDELNAGRVGLGRILPSLSDIRKKKNKRKEASNVFEADLSLSSKEDFTKKVCSITNQIAKNFVELGEVIAKGDKDFPGIDNIKKIQRVATEAFTKACEKTCPPRQENDLPPFSLGIDLTPHVDVPPNINVVVKNQRAERDRHQRKPKDLPSYHRSPYYDRYIDVLKKMTKVEKMLCNYVLDTGDSNEVFYHNGDFHVERHHVSSLLEGVVTKNVIDIWALILNQKDLGRGFILPKRFLCSATTCANRSSSLSRAAVVAPFTRPTATAASTGQSRSSNSSSTADSEAAKAARLGATGSAELS